MVTLGLGLANQAAQDTSEGDGLVHGAARRSRSQRLKMEGQVVLDGSAGLDGFNLEGGADVGQGGGTEGQRFGVVLLPSLVFGAEVEGARVLEVGGEHDGLVPGFSGKLDAQVPSVESHKDKVEVLRIEVLGSKGIEAIDRVPEGSGISNVFPRQGCQACCRAQSDRQHAGFCGLGNATLTAQGRDGSIDRLDEDTFVVQLERGSN